jgi:hypothetical protein
VSRFLNWEFCLDLRLWLDILHRSIRLSSDPERQLRGLGLDGVSHIHFIRLEHVIYKLQ